MSAEPQQLSRRSMAKLVERVLMHSRKRNVVLPTNLATGGGVALKDMDVESVLSSGSVSSQEELLQSPPLDPKAQINVFFQEAHDRVRKICDGDGNFFQDLLDSTLRCTTAEYIRALKVIFFLLQTHAVDPTASLRFQEHLRNQLSVTSLSDQVRSCLQGHLENIQQDDLLTALIAKITSIVADINPRLQKNLSAEDEKGMRVRMANQEQLEKNWKGLLAQVKDAMCHAMNWTMAQNANVLRAFLQKKTMVKVKSPDKLKDLDPPSIDDIQKIPTPSCAISDVPVILRDQNNQPLVAVCSQVFDATVCEIGSSSEGLVRILQTLGNNYTEAVARVRQNAREGSTNFMKKIKPMVSQYRYLCEDTWAMFQAHPLPIPEMINEVQSLYVLKIIRLFIEEQTTLFITTTNTLAAHDPPMGIATH